MCVTRWKRIVISMAYLMWPSQISGLINEVIKYTLAVLTIKVTFLCLGLWYRQAISYTLMSGSSPSHYFSS